MITGHGGTEVFHRDFRQDLRASVSCGGDRLHDITAFAPAALLAVCYYLRDEKDLRFNYLSCISGVDYFEPDPAKAARSG